MATEQEICDLIRNRQSVVYKYEKEGRAVGERMGAPHILYCTTKAQKLIVHMWKTGGVQTDPSMPIPGIRAYSLANIVVLRTDGNFDPQPPTPEGGGGFNPQSRIYSDTICSVYK